MIKKIPEKIIPKLKRVGDADTFQLLGDGHPVLPPGQFVLTFEFIEETAGGITEKPLIDLEQVETNSATYQEIVKIVISEKRGYLDNIAFGSDQTDYAQWRLTIRGDEKFADKKCGQNVNLDLEGIDLFEGDVVLLEGKSDGAQTVKFDGVITARELG